MRISNLWLLFVGLFICNSVFAGGVILFSGGPLKNAKDNNEVFKIDKNQTIKDNKIWFRAQCVNPQDYHVRISRFDGKKNTLILELEGTIGGASLLQFKTGHENEHTVPVIKQPSNEVEVKSDWANLSMVEFKFLSAGDYTLELKVDSNGVCSDTGDGKYENPNVYKIEVQPRSSNISTQLIGKDVRRDNETYYVPYSIQEPLNFVTSINENNNADLKHLKSCRVVMDSLDVSSGKVKTEGDVIKVSDDMAVGQRSIDPRYIKRGEQISITTNCELSGEHGLNGAASNSPKIFIKRELPDFGSPNLTWNNDTSMEKQFDWAKGVEIGADADHLKIKVIVQHPSKKNFDWDYCTITGAGVNLQNYSYTAYVTNKMNNETNNDLKVSSLGKEQKDIGVSGTAGAARFSGVCYEDQGHWDPYSWAIPESITLRREASQILPKKEVTGSLKQHQPSIHPGDTWSMNAKASLSSFYPNATATWAWSGSSSDDVENIQCGDFGQRSNNKCLVSYGTTTEAAGEIKVQLASKHVIKTKRTLYATLKAENHDLKDKSKEIALDEKTVDIVPQITMQGWFDKPAIQVGSHNPDTAGIVLHQGRKLTLLLSNYKLVGNMPEGGQNGETAGKLTALYLTLPEELSTTSAPTWGLENATTSTASTAWTGRDLGTKLNSEAVDYKENQAINVKIPLEVKGEVEKELVLKIAGQYSTNQAEVLDNHKFNPTDIRIKIGDKLLPAKEVFKVNVNSSEELRLSPDPKSNHNDLVVLFEASKAVSGVNLWVTLPALLERDESKDLDLRNRNEPYLCSAPRSPIKSKESTVCLDNLWKQSGVLVRGLAMAKGDEFKLRIPVKLAVDARATEKTQEIEVTIGQDDQNVDQDTAERVVEWKTPESLLKVSKPVRVQARGEIIVHGLVASDQKLNLADKTFEAAVSVDGASDGDRVVLKQGKQSWEMKADNCSEPHSERYCASKVPLLTQLEQTLRVEVISKSGEQLADQSIMKKSDVTRTLKCQELTHQCTLIWKSDRVPYRHVGSSNSMEFHFGNTDLNVRQQPGKKSWFEEDFALSQQDRPWKSLTLFPPARKVEFDALPAVNIKTDTSTASFLMDGVLPINGSFLFDYAPM